MKVNDVKNTKPGIQPSKKARRQERRLVTRLANGMGMFDIPGNKQVEERLLATSEHVPEQKGGFTCGYNSTARSLALLGEPVADYPKYVADAPYYPGAMSGVLTPKALAKHVNKSAGALHLQALENHSKTWTETARIIDRELNAGRPVIPLIRNGKEPDSFGSHFCLHYFTIAAKERFLGATLYTVLDTFNGVYKMTAEELHDRMNISGPVQSVLRGLGFMHKFNLISFKER